MATRLKVMVLVICDVRVLDEEEEGYLATSLVSYPYPDLEISLFSFTPIWV